MNKTENKKHRTKDLHLVTFKVWWQLWQRMQGRVDDAILPCSIWHSNWTKSKHAERTGEIYSHISRSFTPILCLFFLFLFYLITILSKIQKFINIHFYLQKNKMTSWIDGSFVYSTVEPWVNLMRSYENGYKKILNDYILTSWNIL